MLLLIETLGALLVGSAVAERIPLTPWTVTEPAPETTVAAVPAAGGPAAGGPGAGAGAIAMTVSSDDGQGRGLLP